MIAGDGVIIDSYTDPTVAPTSTHVSWITMTLAFPVSPVAGDLMYYSISSAGTLIGRAGAITPAQVREEIFLGMAIFNGSEWGEVSSPLVVNNSVHMLNEFVVQVLGPTYTIDGGSVSEIPAFSLEREAGTVWERNRNWHVDKKDPHREAFSAMPAMSWRYITSGFEAVSVLVNAVDPTVYESPLGTVSGVPGGTREATIQRLYIDPRDNLWMMYGQNTYGSYEEAISQIGVDGANTVVPGLMGLSQLLGYVVCERGTSDWADENARFISVREAAGGGGSSTVTFDELTDTPSSKVGAANKGLAVNTAEDAIEYVDFVLDAAYQSHLANVSNPHAVTPQQVVSWHGMYETTSPHYALIFTNGDNNKKYNFDMFGGHRTNFRSIRQEITMSFATSFFYEYWHFGSINATSFASSVRAYDNGDGTHSVYACISLNFGCPVIDGIEWDMLTNEINKLSLGSLSQTVPSGTLVFDSADHVTYPPTSTYDKASTRPKHNNQEVALLSDVGAGGGATNFDALTDTPSSKIGHATKMVTVNSAEDALEFTDVPTGVAQTFDALTDTPGSKAGKQYQFPRVNDGESALEYTSDVAKESRRIESGGLGIITINGVIGGSRDLSANISLDIASPNDTGGGNGVVIGASYANPGDVGHLDGQNLTQIITGNVNGVYIGSSQSFDTADGKTITYRIINGIITQWDVT